jgi:uncharacterized membrane protein YhaH (DUF805 family)
MDAGDRLGVLRRTSVGMVIVLVLYLVSFSTVLLPVAIMASSLHDVGRVRGRHAFAFAVGVIIPVSMRLCSNSRHTLAFR